MKHKWIRERRGFGNWRVCENCGAEQKYDCTGGWIGNWQYGWTPKVGRCKGRKPMEAWERMAKQAGGEAKANRRKQHMTKADRDDIAAYHPAATWSTMSEADQNRAMDIFQAAYDGKSAKEKSA